MREMKTIHIKSVKNDSLHVDMFHVYQGKEMVDWFSTDEEERSIGRTIVNAVRRVQAEDLVAPAPGGSGAGSG